MHGITQYMHYKLAKAVREGHDIEYVKIRKTDIESNIPKKQEVCRAWLQGYIDCFCEQDPASKEAHLPVIMQAIELYELFVLDMITNHGKTLQSNDMPQPGIYCFDFLEKTFSFLI